MKRVWLVAWGLGAAALGTVFVDPATAQKGPCAIGGLEPGMNANDVVAALGRPAIQMKNEATPTNAASTTMGWTTSAAVTEVEVDAQSAVTRVYWKQLAGMEKGPFGVRVGKDFLRDAVRRIGRDAVAVGTATCAGGHVRLAVAATCRADGTKLTLALVLAPQSGVPCDAVPSIDALLDAAGKTLIQDVTIEHGAGGQ